MIPDNQTEQRKRKIIRKSRPIGRDFLTVPVRRCIRHHRQPPAHLLYLEEHIISQYDSGENHFKQNPTDLKGDTCQISV